MADIEAIAEMSIEQIQTMLQEYATEKLAALQARINQLQSQGAEINTQINFIENYLGLR